MPSPNRKITIFLAEDHHITRSGLKLALDQINEFEVIGEAIDGRTAAQKILELKPTVVVLDLGLPVLDGIEVAKRVKNKNAEIQIIVFTSHNNDEDIFAALEAGADGYCLKDAPTEQLELAIRTVAEGGAWLDPTIAKKVLQACVSTPRKPSQSKDTSKSKRTAILTDREIQVLKFVSQGLSNKEIADKLTLSDQTIKSHVRNIMEKLVVSDRTEAAVKAMREGLIS